MEQEKQARVEVKVNFLSIDRSTGSPNRCPEGERGRFKSDIADLDR